MESNVLNIILGFIEGLGLIISPCILPIVPIFLATSLTGSKLRPLGMIVGFTLFFAILIFFSRQLVNYLGLNLEVVRSIGYVLLILFGIVMLSNYLTEKFSQFTQVVARTGTVFSPLNKTEGGFLNGLFLGGIIALIWTPCAGPILAAIIVQTVVQKTTIVSFFILIAFALGAVIPLFIISLYGKRLMNAVVFLKSRATLFRKLLGALLIASVIYLIHFEHMIGSTSVTSTGIKTSNSLIDGLWHPYPAPKIECITDWINSTPLQLSDLKGKVVLVDFWTYSCINCLRTLPYLNDWYRRYHDKGLVIIGVHTPEFDFEKNLTNVHAAVQRAGILYPVALDNQFATWINFNNHYWPAHYLINKEGNVVYEHFGEGEYAVTENNIRFLLGMNGVSESQTLPNNFTDMSQTPETYLGYDRADTRFSPNLIQNKTVVYHFMPQLHANSWSLDGLWQVNADSITAEQENAALKIRFKARKVFMVMGSSTGKPITIKVLLNNKAQNNILVNKYSLYDVVSQQDVSSSELILIATEPGVKIYTFTFGN